jgi:DNA (cytosine-5)-methyltransferase 1
MKFVDLFCGAGGFSQGFVAAGHELIYGVDNWSPAIATFSSYFGKRRFKKINLGKTKIKDIISLLKSKNKIDCIIGGPPCQGFSSMGNQKQGDPRNLLLIRFAKIVKEIQPDVFLLENVSGVSGKNFTHITKKLKEIFKSAGYTNTLTQILDAQNYGVPQRRKRFFMIGVKSKNVKLSFPEPVKKEIKVGDVINDLSRKKAEFMNHVAMKHNPIVKGRLRFIPEGGNLDPSKLPEKYLYGSRSDFKLNKVKRFSHIYKRLSRNEVSGTIVPGHNAFPIHPTEDRSLTVREAARIQTLSDRIEFFGTRQDQCILVGNAVPSNLAFHLGKHITNLINSNAIQA